MLWPFLLCPEYDCDLDFAQLWSKILIDIAGWVAARVGSQALNLMMKGSMVINSHA